MLRHLTAYSRDHGVGLFCLETGICQRDPVELFQPSAQARRKPGPRYLPLLAGVLN